MVDYISLAGFVLAVFIAGIGVGRFVEKVERLTDELDVEEHGTRKNAHKNDRR